MTASIDSLLEELENILSKLDYVKAGDVILAEHHNYKLDVLWKIKEILEDLKAKVSELEQAVAPAPAPEPILTAIWPTYRHDFQRTGYQPKPVKYIVLNGYWEWFIVYKVDGSALYTYYNQVGSVDGSPVVDEYGKMFLPLDDGLVRTGKVWGLIDGWYITAGYIPYGLTLRDNKLYIPSGDYGLHIIDLVTGERRVYYTEGEIYCPPYVDDQGNIYFGSQDGYIYALNPDGTLKWRYYVGGEVRGGPAVLSDGTMVFGGTNNCVHAMDPNGNEKWRFCTEDWIYDTPAIGPDDTIYFASQDDYLYALNPNGTLKWKYYLGQYAYYRFPPAVDPNRGVYLLDDDNVLHAVDFNGNPRWTLSMPGTGRISIGPDGTIYTGAGGKLTAVNPDGTIKFQVDIPEKAYSEPVLVG